MDTATSFPVRAATLRRQAQPRVPTAPAPVAMTVPPLAQAMLGPSRAEMTARQIAVLALAAANPSASNREMRTVLACYACSITRCLEALEALGFLYRRPDPKDARRTTTVMLDPGVRALAEIHAPLGAAEG